MLPNDHSYEHVSSFDTSSFTELLGLDNTILTDIEMFIHCIIKFEQCSILVKSFDLFAHCQSSNDDCANGFRFSDVSIIPTAKIQKKNTLNKIFKEVSIFITLYELLVVGGYVIKDNMIILLLDSSLGSLDLPDSTSNNIIIPISRLQVIKTERLLNQYFKRCSFNLWGYHSMLSVTRGFMPIIPVSYMSHYSQKHRNTNMHHLASKVLSLISSGRLLDQESLQQV